MDISDTYYSLWRLVKETQGCEGLADRMAPADRDLTASKDKKIFELFLQAVYENEEKAKKAEREKTEDDEKNDLSGWIYASAFCDKLAAQKIEGSLNLALKLTKLGRQGWSDQAARVLAADSYALMYWLVDQLRRFQSPSPSLEHLCAAIKPELVNDKGEKKINAYTQAHLNLVLNKPDFAFNGFSNVTTFLLMTGNETAQSVLLRLGQVLWSPLFPMYTLYSPKDGSEQGFEFDTDESGVSYKSKDIARFITFFLFLGYRLKFSINGKEFSLEFPFRITDPTDIILTLPDGNTVAMEYLDDLDKEMPQISTTPLKLCAESDSITLIKPKKA